MKHELPFPVRRAKHGGLTIGRQRRANEPAKSTQGRFASARAKPRTRWVTGALRITFAVAILAYVYLSLAYLPDKFRQYGVVIGLIGVLAVLICIADNSRHVCMAIGDFFTGAGRAGVKFASAMDRIARQAYRLGDRIRRWIDNLFD